MKETRTTVRDFNSKRLPFGNNTTLETLNYAEFETDITLNFQFSCTVHPPCLDVVHITRLFFQFPFSDFLSCMTNHLSTPENFNSVLFFRQTHFPSFYPISFLKSPITN